MNLSHEMLPKIGLFYLKTIQGKKGKPSRQGVLDNWISKGHFSHFEIFKKNLAVKTFFQEPPFGIACAIDQFTVKSQCLLSSFF